MDPKFLEASHEWNGAIDFGSNDKGNYVGIQLISYHRSYQKPDETLEELLTRTCAGALAALETEIENV